MICIIKKVPLNLHSNEQNHLIVERDVDEVRRDLLRHKRHVVKAAAAGLHFGTDRRLGGRHHQLESSFKKEKR